MNNFSKSMGILCDIFSGTQYTDAKGDMGILKSFVQSNLVTKVVSVIVINTFRQFTHSF